MEELLVKTGYQPHGLKKGQEIEGIISSLTPRGIRVDIGAKAESLVLEKDKRILDDLLSTLKVGDKVRAVVLNPESEEGFAVLSLRRQRKKKAWQQVTKAQEQDEPLKVVVTDLTRGGVLADFGGVRGFIPLSHLVAPLDEKILGKTLQVKVLEVAPQENRLLFSQKTVSIKPADLQKEMAKIKINQVYTGTISGITNFGLFVRINPSASLPSASLRAGGIEGLVHISEISWGRVEDLEKQFKIGQQVQVLVTGVDLKTQKLNLSLRQLMPDPWMEISKKFTTDQEVQGKVSRTSRVGIFVLLEEGLEGLIPKSKIPIGQILKEQDKVNCVVESVDVQKRRINLTPVLKEKPIGYK